MQKVKKYPWIADGAIHFMDEYLTVEMEVLEFGAGGSTAWLAKRCRHLTTIEHNPHWIDNVRPHVGPNWTPLFKRLPYHQLCDEWGDCSFDLILIDGKDRVDCAESAVRLIKPGGVLVLDNSNRSEYTPVGSRICQGWVTQTAVNKTADNIGGTRAGCTTSWWRKPT